MQFVIKSQLKKDFNKWRKNIKLRRKSKLHNSNCRRCRDPNILLIKGLKEVTALLGVTVSGLKEVTSLGAAVAREISSSTTMALSLDVALGMLVLGTSERGIHH